MANPTTIECPKDTWTLVASSVTRGVVRRKKLNPNKYLQTYRDTGDDAPTEVDEGQVTFQQGEMAVISSATAIDVYIMAVDAAGSVRVDLI